MSKRGHREAEALARLCEEQGFEVKRTRKGYRVLGKQREDGTAGWHRTPSDHRAFKNARAALRRIGVQV